MKRTIAAGLFAFALLLGCQNKDDSQRIKAELREVTELVYASVTIRPESSYFPQSTFSGLVEEVFVKEGDAIQKGAPLFRIASTASLENSLTKAELDLTKAKANYQGQNNLLSNLEAEIETAENQLNLDSNNFERHQRLREKNIGKAIDYEQAKLKFDASKNRLQVLHNQYVQLQVDLENAYQSALSRAKAENLQIQELTIFSELDGKVYQIHKEVGEIISPQEPFGEIGDAQSFLVEMEIDEVDITKVELADTISLTLDAYPNEMFQAKVVEIAPKKNDRTQTFTVKGRFIELPDKLFNGLSGEANIKVDQRANSLIIPAEYLMDGNKVLTPEGEVEVQIGVKNLERIEILSGIDTNTLILKPEIL